MDLTLHITFSAPYILSLCNWLVGVNAGLHVEHGRKLPLLYDSAVVYEREERETFRDVVHLYKVGREDCDSLAPARAGELVARGWEALADGDEGFEVARSLRPRTIEAQCFLTTRDRGPGPRLYHVEVAYWVGGVRFHDDPSARLGMNGPLDPLIVRRRTRSLSMRSSVGGRRAVGVRCVSQ